MRQTRRSILRTASTLPAVALGFSGRVAAVDCSSYPAWDVRTLYAVGDRVHHPDKNGVDALWEAAIQSRTAEPTRSSVYWDYVGDCDGGSGGDGGDGGDGGNGGGGGGDGGNGGGGGTNGKRVIGYWMQWAQYQRDYVPADIPTDQVTHLQYAFMRPESDGTITGLGDSYAQRFLFPQSHHNVTSFGDIASNTDVTCLISIGGWNDSGNFSDVAQSQSSRQTFADECVRIVREAGVNGVDIDWEYPGGGGKPGNTVRAGDQHRFTLLLEECRTALDAAGTEDGTTYHLSAALTADPKTAEGVHQGNEGLEHGTLSELLDFASIMTFDYAGNWSSYSAHQSPLHHNSKNPIGNAAQWNVSAGLQYYVDKGWNPSQLNMATPFYCRSFANVAPPDGSGNGTADGLYQPFNGTGEGSFPPDTSQSGIYDYWDVATSGGERASSHVDLSKPGWETMYDDTAVSAWSYNKDQSLMLTHETLTTVETKMNWLVDNGYGGTMIWALSHDTVDHTLLTALSSTLL